MVLHGGQDAFIALNLFLCFLEESISINAPHDRIMQLVHVPINELWPVVGVIVGVEHDRDWGMVNKSD